MKRAPRPGSARWIRLRDPALAERFAALAPEMERAALAALLGNPMPPMSPDLRDARAALAALLEE